MRHRSLGPLLAVALSACTFTTADVGPTATSLRTAHGALATEFSQLDAQAAPTKEAVDVVCRDPAQDAFVGEFCQRWNGLTDGQRAERLSELSLRADLNRTLAALLAYVEALDALVKSREQSEMQAEALEARLNGLSSVSAALGGAASFFSPVAASAFTAVASGYDDYTRTHSAYHAAREAQPVLDHLAAGVRALLGECDVALSARIKAAIPDALEACDANVALRHREIADGVVARETASAERLNQPGYSIYSTEEPGALTRLHQAYGARFRAQQDGNAANEAAANRAIDAAVRDLEALAHVRPQYDAAMAVRRTAEQWRDARTRGRLETARAFVSAADQNAALVDAIQRERQLDLGPLGFIIRSLLGA